MKELLAYINEKTNNEYLNVKLSNVIFDKQFNIASFKFVSHPSTESLNDNDRETLKKYTIEYLKENNVILNNVEIFVRKAILDIDVINDIIMRFLKDNYFSIYSNFKKSNIVVDFKDEIVNVGLKLVNFYYSFLSNRNFEQELTEVLNNSFFTVFNVELIKVEMENTDEVLQKRFEQINFPTQETKKEIYKYTINGLQSFIGDLVEDKAILIEDVKQPQTGITIAGNVKFITKKTFLSKKKNENGEAIEKEYYSFSIFDETGNMPCVMFLSQTDLPKMQELKENSFIVAFGDVEKFNEKLNFKVKRISYGESANIERQEQTVTLKSVNDKYMYIRPEPYIMLEQSNLFFEEKPVNEFLLNNEVVVFDFETTGLESSVHEIIEIGAVKIVKGKITETFSCLVKPKNPISEEITSITGITNDMVANSFTIEQVLQDFYKFTYNCVLSAYNIAFDYSFLFAISKKLGFAFTNRQIDAMFLAKSKLPGLKNYRLKTVATALGINLDNAHRAVYDAIATAEVFIKLSDNLK